MYGAVGAYAPALHGFQKEMAAQAAFYEAERVRLEAEAATARAEAAEP